MDLGAHCPSLKSRGSYVLSIQNGQTTSMQWINYVNRSDYVLTDKTNPLVEYQTEGYKMFEDMIGIAIEYEITMHLYESRDPSKRPT